MAWAERRFKKKSKVWIEVDDDGEPVVDNGRVSMRYSNDDDAKVYSASLRNLSDSTASRTKKTSSNRPSFDDSVWMHPEGELYSSDELPRELAELAPPDQNVWEFHTDGACSGNPGACGWGWVLRRNDEYLEANQYIGTGTNNIAELMAIKTALEHVPVDANESVHIYTDSNYSLGVLTKGWKAKKNTELIESIRARIDEFETTPIFHKVKGHSGHPLNERADFMATSSIEDL